MAATSNASLSQFVAVEFEILEDLVTKDIFNQVIRSVKGSTRAMFQEYARDMQRSANKKYELERINRLAAMGALETALQSYESRKSARKASYRNADPDFPRFSGGLMNAALLDYRAVEWGYNGFNLFDKNVFDRYARQWYRLNFGAGPAQTPNRDYGTMTFGGQPTNFGLSLAQYPESAPFKLPKGFFSMEFNPNNQASSRVRPSPSRRGDAFYLYKPGSFAPKSNTRARSTTGKKKNSDSSFVTGGKISEGIIGSRFLDDGVIWANKFYGNALTGVVEQWHEKAKASAARVGRTAGSRGGGLTGLSEVERSIFSGWLGNSNF